MSGGTVRLEVENPSAYQEKLQALVGDRDPLDLLAETPQALARLIAGRSPEQLRRRPFQGKWTPTEILGHLLDSEWVFGYRVRTILCDARPPIVPMDQERWVAEQGHNERDGHELLAEFTALRRINLALWRRIPKDALSRVGVHAERGEESLGLMLKMEAGHDRSHIDQLDRYLKALG